MTVEGLAWDIVPRTMVGHMKRDLGEKVTVHAR